MEDPRRSRNRHVSKEISLMPDLIRRFKWKGRGGSDPEPLISREWLVTNGLGGYASGTISGVNSRRYHGFLISAEPAPFGRVNMFSHLLERVWLPDGREIELGRVQRVGSDPCIPGSEVLQEFRLEAGLPFWTYRIDQFLIEKR